MIALDSGLTLAAACIALGGLYALEGAERRNPRHIGDQLHLEGGQHGEYAVTAEEAAEYAAREAAYKRERDRERFASLPKGASKPRKPKTRNMFTFHPHGEDRQLYAGQKPLLFENPEFFEEGGQVHPIRASEGYEELATYGAQRALHYKRPELLRQLEVAGALRTPIQVQRQEAEQERRLERDYQRDTKIARDRWMRGWSRKHLIGLAEYAGIPTAELGTTAWLGDLDPYKVFEYHDRALSAREKRSYGLPGGPNSQNDHVHARNARKKRRAIQRRAA